MNSILMDNVKRPVVSSFSVDFDMINKISNKYERYKHLRMMNGDDELYHDKEPVNHEGRHDWDIVICVQDHPRVSARPPDLCQRILD